MRSQPQQPSSIRQKLVIIAIYSLTLSVAIPVIVVRGAGEAFC